MKFELKRRQADLRDPAAGAGGTGRVMFLVFRLHSVPAAAAHVLLPGRSTGGKGSTEVTCSLETSSCLAPSCERPCCLNSPFSSVVLILRTLRRSRCRSRQRGGDQGPRCYRTPLQAAPMDILGHHLDVQIP